MPSRQHCTPHLVSNGLATALPRVDFEDRELDEKQYQVLLFQHPTLVPVKEIEPLFSPLIPLARELPSGKGGVDIAYINPEGYLTLVETKLWRNPDARRDVIAQIIEYAAEIAKWTYADLRSAVRRAWQTEDYRPRGVPLPGGDRDPIVALVSDESDFDEARFIDTVSSNLRRGRFLLLIVGDGIQDGVEELAAVLQESPHLRFTLALVETAVYRMEGSGRDYFVQSRVLLRTKEIVRHVVEIQNLATGVTVNVRKPDDGRAGDEKKPTSITESAFFEQLEQNTGPDAVTFARWFVDEVNRTPQMRLTWNKDGPALWWDDDTEESQAGFLRLCANGELSSTNSLPSYCVRSGVPLEIADAFQDGLVRLLGDARRVEKGAEGYTHVVARHGGRPSFVPLAKKSEEFWKLITATTDSLSKALIEKRKMPGA